MTFQVAAGVAAFAVRGDWFDMHLHPIKTAKLNVFGADAVLVSPDAAVKAKHGVNSQTTGGDYARMGYYAFRGPGGQCLVVHRQSVQVINGSKTDGGSSEPKAAS